MENKLLSDWFEDVLDNSMVCETFALDGEEEGMETLFSETKSDCSHVVTMDSDHSIYEVKSWDMPTLVLFSPDDEVVGYYHNFQCFIHPDHRGHGLGVEMILTYARHFKDQAWSGSEDADEGIGFSIKGYEIHAAAREAAQELAHSSSLEGEDDAIPFGVKP